MGTHLRVLSESYLMGTNIIGFRWFLSILELWTKVVLELKGLNGLQYIFKRNMLNTC